MERPEAMRIKGKDASSPIERLCVKLQHISTVRIRNGLTGNTDTSRPVMQGIGLDGASVSCIFLTAATMVDMASGRGSIKEKSPEPWLLTHRGQAFDLRFSVTRHRCIVE
jgi:hypothetical protein